MKRILWEKTGKASIFANIIAISVLLAISACGGSSGGDTNDNNNNGTLDDGMVWSAPELLENSDFNVHDMDVAVSGNNSFVAVWNQDIIGSNEAVHSSELIGSGSWSVAEKISADVFSVTDGPEIDVNSNGSGLVVWCELNMGSPLITQRSLTYESVNGFGLASELIYSNDIYFFERGDVSVALNGDAVFAASLNSLPPRIWSASYNGSNWAGGGNIDSGIGNTFNPALAGNSGGVAFTVWESDGHTIYAARYDGSGWAAAVEISTGTDNEDPQVAVDESNNAIVVWENSESSYFIYAVVYTHGSGWSSPQAISSNGRAAGANPQIGFDGSGNAIAVWEENVGINRTIYSNRYTPGSGWGTDLMIGNLSGEAWDPMISVNSTGKAVVLWEQEESGSYNMYTARYIPSPGGWMPAELLETDSGDSRYGRIAVDSNGNAVAVWRHDDGSYTSLKAAHLR